MRRYSFLLAALLCACAHTSGPNVKVIVTRMGPIYPPLANNCPVAFVNAEYVGIVTSGKFEQLGTVAFAGEMPELRRAASRVPDAVAAAVCKMGGNAVSIGGLVETSSDVGVLQFNIWHSKEKLDVSPPEKKPAVQSI